MAKHTPDLNKQVKELESVIRAVELTLDEMLEALPTVQQINPTLAQHYLLKMMEIAEGRDNLRDALDTVHAARFNETAESRKPSAKISKMVELQAELFAYTESTSTTIDLMAIITKYV